MSAADRGFLFSGLGDQHAHEAQNPAGRTHYKKLGAPVVKTSAAMVFMTRLMNRAARNPAIKRRLKRLHGRNAQANWTT
jgi:hypothetical protein